ncbi:MAG: hypothetical protein PHR16_04680 [Methylovulum sp.]|nr:hypothetical protein [Methylovulum sp.]
MKILLTSSLILFLSACASPAKDTYTLPENLSTITPANPLACRFEKQLVNEQKPQSTDWYFWRDALRTETRDELSNQGEIWEHNKTGQLFYTRIFYNDRVAIDFVPGDLAAMGNTVSWQQLGSLIDPATLGKELLLQNKKTVNQVAVEYYSGTLNGIPTEVDWLPVIQLPARLTKKLPEKTITVTLSECAPASKLAVQPITKAELDSFRHIDYTDLGDMESDPIAQRIEQLMGEHHHQDH